MNEKKFGKGFITIRTFFNNGKKKSDMVATMQITHYGLKKNKKNLKKYWLEECGIAFDKYIKKIKIK